MHKVCEDRPITPMVTQGDSRYPPANRHEKIVIISSVRKFNTNNTSVQAIFCVADILTGSLIDWTALSTRSL